jgi:hypothetical protein
VSGVANSLYELSIRSRNSFCQRRNKRLLWPDTLSWGPNGEMYVIASQIENMPRFNDGKSTRTQTYKLWKITDINPE